MNTSHRPFPVAAAALSWLALASMPAHAAPSFRISQIYSSLDGSTQFIRLTETEGADGQDHFAGLTLTSTHNGITRQFIFQRDLPTDRTAHLSILVAASPSGRLTGLVPAGPNSFWSWDFLPDYVIPPRFLATDGGSVDFAGVDRVTYASLPTDGENALNHDASIARAIVAPSFCMPSGPHPCGSFATFPPAVSVVEYYNANRDHYFYSASAPDIDALDTERLTGWHRTGNSFLVQASPASLGQVAGVQPVCRFYIPPDLGDSHVFTASPQECDAVRRRFPAFDLESEAAFYVYPTWDANSSLCESVWDYAGLIPVYRLWNARADSNHRYTTSRIVRDAMVAQGYVAEGDGPDRIAFCSG